MKRGLLLVVLAVLAWQLWPLPVPAVSPRPPAVAPVDGDPFAAPVQRDLEHGPRFTVNGIAARALAEYTVSGRVLSATRYRLGRGADLAPVDLALGWGRMSDPRVIDRLDIHQGGRWYFWRYEGAPPLPVDEITRSSANVHLIPANRAVARALRRADAGQRITLRGYLVELRAADGWHWTSSLRRDDSGDGSCELMYVQAVSDG
ncbi:hypothetical protein [Immundisolibacter sp.]|uniref:hypothetical protein n=1 Tax=Immundisolibacter sp. TaxID=1934948 RepID=UPI003563360D